MKCVACGRVLGKPAFTMPSRNGILAWGPKCGKHLVQLKKVATPVPKQPKRRYEDKATLDLFAEAA